MVVWPDADPAAGMLCYALVEGLAVRLACLSQEHGQAEGHDYGYCETQLATGLDGLSEVAQ